jgi:hypothetical protein
MLLYVPFLLAACIAFNGNTSSAALQPFDDVVGAISNANAGGRGRSNVNAIGNGNRIGQSVRHASPSNGSTNRRRSIRRRSTNDNAVLAIQTQAAHFMRRDQEKVDESSSTAAPSAAPSEAGSIEEDNNFNEATMTTTSSTMVEEVPGDNDDNDTDVITATNLTSSSISSSMNTISPSLSPPVTSMETSSNATIPTDTSATTLDEDVNDEGGTSTNSPSPSNASFSISTTSPSNINGSGSGEESVGNDDNEEGEGTDSLGTPVIHDFSNVPTPSSTGDGNWIDDHINSNDVDDYYYEQQQGSFEPTPSTMYYNGNNGNDDLYGVVETIWEELHTPSPTVVYVPPPSEKDPLSKEGAEEVEGADEGVGDGDEGDDSNNNNGDDNVLYHGLGGNVGTYMDSIESPTEMEHDKNVQIVTATLLSIFIVTLLITAHLVMHHPDGLCAGCCRLALRFIGCVSRTLCLPCRAVCCSGGSEQSRSRRSHAPMRTPFPTDLELT